MRKEKAPYFSDVMEKRVTFTGGHLILTRPVAKQPNYQQKTGKEGIKPLQHPITIAQVWAEFWDGIPETIMPLCTSELEFHTLSGYQK